MTAGQTLDGQANKEHAVLNGFVLVVESGHGAASAGTTYKDIAFLLIVEVNHHSALQEISRHGFGTGETGLLVTGEHTLQRTMLDVRGTEDGNLHGTANTVIGTQGCTLGLHPFAVHVCLNGIVLEVKLNIVVLLANHVHVTLQYNNRSVLHTRSGRLADDNIAYLVAHCLQTKTAAYLQQVLHHLVLLLGRTGNTVYLTKCFKNRSGFQFHHIFSNYLNVGIKYNALPRSFIWQISKYSLSLPPEIMTLRLQIYK